MASSTLRTPNTNNPSGITRTRSGADEYDSRDNSMQRVSSQDEDDMTAASITPSPDPLSPAAGGRKGGNLLHHSKHINGNATGSGGNNSNGNGNGYSHINIIDSPAESTPGSPKITIPLGGSVPMTGSPIAGGQAGLPGRPMSNSPITLAQKQRIIASSPLGGANTEPPRDRSPLLVSSSVTRLSHHGSHHSGNNTNGGDDSDHTPAPAVVIIRSPHAVNHSRGSIDMAVVNGSNSPQNNNNGSNSPKASVPVRTPSMLHNNRTLNNAGHDDDLIASSGVARDAAGSAHNGAFGVTRHASHSGRGRRPSFDRVPSARNIMHHVRSGSLGDHDDDGPAGVMAIDTSPALSEMNTVRTMTGTAADEALLSGRGAIGSEAGGSFLGSPVGSINVNFPTTSQYTTAVSPNIPLIAHTAHVHGDTSLYYAPNSVTSAAAAAISTQVSGSTSKVAPLGSRLNASAQRYAVQNSSRNHESSTSGSAAQRAAALAGGIAGSVNTNYLRPAIANAGNITLDEEGRPLKAPHATQNDDEPSRTSQTEPAAMVVDEDEDSATRERKKNELAAIGPADLPNLAQIVHRFNNSLRLFRYLLILGGLHQRTSSCYRNYLKLILWLCAALCIGNMGFKTASYRNALFDVVLMGLHLWVATSYHLWEKYLATRHWKGLMQIVSQHRHEQFSKRVNLIGILALLGVPAASAAIYTGWIIPIVQSMISDYSNHSSLAHYTFLWLHGVIMTILIIPWSAVCLCSVFLFHLVGLAHKTDIDSYYSFLIAHFTRAGTSADQYTIAMKKHKPLRDRLNATCSYFGILYPAFVMLAFMLVLSAAWDINLILLAGASETGSNLSPYHMIQDMFYLGLGLVAAVFGLWSSASITSYWCKFVERMNDCAHKIMIVSHPMHASLISYFQNSNTAYRVFGYTISPTSSVQITFAFVQLSVVALVVLNFSQLITS